MLALLDNIHINITLFLAVDLILRHIKAVNATLVNQTMPERFGLASLNFRQRLEQIGEQRHRPTVFEPVGLRRRFYEILL